MIVKKYGNDELRLVIVHGGPGAAGSMEGMARQYGEYCGVLEPWQTEHSVNGQVEELHRQITENCTEKVVLIGHSWGGWIVTLYAARYPETLSCVVLMGCGMFHERYIGELTERRLSKLPIELQEEWKRLVYELNQPDVTNADEKIARLSSIPTSDDYDIIEEQTSCNPDGDMYRDVWPEGASLRADGTLLKEAAKITCPIYIIHGIQDPHPVEGITEPFDEYGIAYTVYKLDQCGHSPWKEKYAKDELKKIILDEILYKYR